MTDDPKNQDIRRRDASDPWIKMVCMFDESERKTKDRVASGFGHQSNKRVEKEKVFLSHVADHRGG